jgi:hypothetical protein
MYICKHERMFTFVYMSLSDFMLSSMSAVTIIIKNINKWNYNNDDHNDDNYYSNNMNTDNNINNHNNNNIYLYTVGSYPSLISWYHQWALWLYVYI